VETKCLIGSRKPWRYVFLDLIMSGDILTVEKANEAFALKEPKIPSLPLSVSQDPSQQGCSELHHACHTGHLTKHVDSSRCLQPGVSNFSASQICFRKEDLQNARIVNQVDRKFIACLVGLEHGPAEVNVSSEEASPPADGKTLILIDQHAADERVRVERFLKKICNGFLCHQEGSGCVEMRQLSPPVPVLLTEREASRLSEVLAYQKTFESWGFQFSSLQDIGVTSEIDTEPDGNAGYTQVFVSAIPEVVSEKVCSKQDDCGEFANIKI
jgi:DNA mismatch repair protein MLH3